MKFLRDLPSSWSGIALILKTKGGLEYISFDDLYNKLKFLEIDTKEYSSSSPTLSNDAFVSTAGSSQGNLSYQESGNGGYGGYTTTLSASPDLDQMNKDKFEEYDLKHQMAMLSIKVHRFEKKHGRKIKFNGRENARFDKKLVKCFNCKQMGHFSRECRAQGVQNNNNYQKYKSKEVEKDGFDSKAMVVVDGSIDWDKQTKECNIDPRSLENFGMLAGIKLESDVDSEGEVVSADDVIPAVVSVSAVPVAATTVSPHSETEFALMGLSTEAKWTNSGKNLYKLIDSSMLVRTKRGLGLDKYIREGGLGIDDFVFSIFHTSSDDLDGQPIYNRIEKAKDRGIVDSGFLRSKISGKGTIKTKNLNFENVLYVEELQHFNLISVSQICYQTHMVLFTETECLVLSKDFPLPDPSMVILSIPRKHNLYTFSLNELAPQGPLTYLIAKASQNESTLWHKRLGHVNFRTMNKLVLRKMSQTQMINQMFSSYTLLLLQKIPLLMKHQFNMMVQSNHSPTNEDNLDEFTELQSLQRQEQAGKEEAERLGLAFPSLNPILGVGSASIGSSVSAGSTPHVSAGSTPPLSPCASPISADCHSISAGQSPVLAARPPVFAGRSTSAGRPTDFAARTPVSMWPGKFQTNLFVRLPQFPLLPLVLMRLQNKCLLDHASDGSAASI
nr:ribonuclease H-like domain-containing protein [Tanacetum cinerariifolium]